MKLSKRALLASLLVAPMALLSVSGCTVDADDDPDAIVTTPAAPDTNVEVKPPDVNVTPPATTTTTTTGG